MDPAVITSQLTKRYGETCALQPLDLTIAGGEWLTVMGHSGSGKTTLLNLLAGLDRPTDGSVRVAGTELAQLDENGLARFRRQAIGIVFQEHYLVPHLTALDNVMLAQYFHSVTDATEARDMLERVGLGKRLHQLPRQLSGGEQQRVCIARALINGPRLLVADEPTGNLDHANTRNVMELLRELHREVRFTLLVVTHNEEVAGWGTRIIRLDDGRLVEDRPTGELRGSDSP
jgi:putative ABC transport system ATP-binding protein